MAGKYPSKGTKIKGIREKLGITQRELAKAAGLSVDSISRVENGASAQLHSYKQIARALSELGSMDLDAGDLFDDGEEVSTNDPADSKEKGEPLIPMSPDVDHSTGLTIPLTPVIPEATLENHKDSLGRPGSPHIAAGVDDDVSASVSKPNRRSQIAILAIVVLGVFSLPLFNRDRSRSDSDPATDTPPKEVTAEMVATEEPARASAPFGEAEAQEYQRRWAKYLGVSIKKEIDLGDRVKLTMILIPPGDFQMGSASEDIDRWLEMADAANDVRTAQLLPLEGQQHQVTISHPFFLGQCEVTQGQWKTMMGDNPSSFQDSDLHPVNRVNWQDILLFLAKLNQEHGEQGLTFTLPTEAQWEYACRAGTLTAWHHGDSEAELRNVAWYIANSHQPTKRRPLPVRRRTANAWMLHDMHGNLSEWCQDWFGPYQPFAVVDPVGPETGHHRVCRGGGWDDPAYCCRSARRFRSYPSHADSRLGFRVAMAIDTTAPIAAQPKAQQSK